MLLTKGKVFLQSLKLYTYRIILFLVCFSHFFFMGDSFAVANVTGTNKKAKAQTKEKTSENRNSVYFEEEVAGVAWSLKAKKFVSENNRGYIEAIGDVILTKDGDKIKADYARLYSESNWLFLKGDIEVKWKADTFTAQEAEFDLVTMNGWLKDSSLYMPDMETYLKAKILNKIGDNSYTFSDATITACEGDSPAWSFKADSGDLVLKDFVFLDTPVLYIKKAPVMILPAITMTVGKKRSTGFLFPEISISNFSVFSLNIPFYLAIDKEKDLTLYQNLMASQGYMQGVEFRLNTDSYTKLLFHADYLFDYNPRWWVRSKYDGWVGNKDWRVLFDVDLISDTRYLQDFTKGISGYDESQDEFVSVFGRGFAEKDSDTRENILMISRVWDEYMFTGSVEYTQNIASWTQNTAAQKLPELNFYNFQENLFNSPLEFQLMARYNYFLRLQGTQGQRLYLQPEISAPAQLSFMTVIPSLAYKQNIYLIDRYENDNNQIAYEGSHTTTDKVPTSGAVEAGLSVFSELNQFFHFDSDLKEVTENIGKSEWLGLGHTIVPEINATWQKNLNNPDTMPYFDALDRLDDTFALEFSLINRLKKKIKTISVNNEDGKQVPFSSISYKDALYLEFMQGVDLQEVFRTEGLSTVDRRILNDFYTKVQFSPQDTINFYSELWISYYGEGLTEQEYGVIFSFPQALLGFSYNQQPEGNNIRRAKWVEDNLYNIEPTSAINVFKVDISYLLNQNLRLGGRLYYDFHNFLFLERALVVEWIGSCYGFSLDVNVGSGDDFQVQFNFNIASF